MIKNEVIAFLLPYVETNTNNVINIKIQEQTTQDE
jgi:hypothetical protein